MSPDTDTDTLTRGRWTTIRGIRRWIPDPNTPPPPPDDFAPEDYTNARACNDCPARPDQACRTRSGAPAHTAHKGRIIPRRCTCGRPLPKGEPRAMRCSTCRRETARDQDPTP